MSKVYLLSYLKSEECFSVSFSAQHSCLVAITIDTLAEFQIRLRKNR